MPDVEVKDKTRTFESHEADLSGHIDNPLGENGVNRHFRFRARQQGRRNQTRGRSEPKPKLEDLASRRDDLLVELEAVAHIQKAA